MDTHWLWKDIDSKVENCPAIGKIPGHYRIVGKKVPVGATSPWGLGPDEVMIDVPDNVIDRLKDL